APAVRGREDGPIPKREGTRRPLPRHSPQGGGGAPADSPIALLGASWQAISGSCEQRSSGNGGRRGAPERLLSGPSVRRRVGDAQRTAREVLTSFATGDGCHFTLEVVG